MIDCEEMTIGEMYELVSTLMRYKFDSDVSNITYSKTFNQLLGDIRKNAARREDTPLKSYLLGIFDHIAQDSRVDEILNALTWECEHQGHRTFSELSELFDDAIWPMSLEEDQINKVQSRLRQISESKS